MANLSIMLQMLEENQTLKISPIGCSMCPFFYGGRDYVYLKRPTSLPLKHGDIALFRRKDGKYVIHRIHHIEATPNGRMYFMLGDNQTWLEGPIPEEELLAVTEQIMRKGKLIDCKKNKFYRFTSMLWLYMRPVRPVFIRLWIWIKPSLSRADRASILEEIQGKNPTP